MQDMFRLTAEEQTTLKANDARINAIRDAIAKLKASGLDVSEMEDRLNQAITIKSGLLQHFGAPVTDR